MVMRHCQSPAPIKVFYAVEFVFSSLMTAQTGCLSPTVQDAAVAAHFAVIR